MFPDIWKTSNMCFVHIKDDKQTISNYQPVPLLPSCGKIFEILVSNPLYEYLIEKKPYQSINLAFGQITHV